MKVLILNGSPHEKGSTYTALNEMQKIFKEENFEIELINIGKMTIKGCQGCNYCQSHGKCVMDDIVNEIALKLKEADGLVIGSPVYYGSANSTLTALLDRLFFSFDFDATMKVGAAICSARRGGLTATFDQLNKYFTISGMPVASGQYWNGIHGHNAEEAVQDLEGMQMMRTLARNMAFLMKSIALGKEKYGLPEREKGVMTNFIREDA